MYLKSSEDRECKLGSIRQSALDLHLMLMDTSCQGVHTGCPVVQVEGGDGKQGADPHSHTHRHRPLEPRPRMTSKEKPKKFY